MYAKRFYKVAVFCMTTILVFVLFINTKKIYSNADFGNAFEKKAIAAENKLQAMQQNFMLCTSISESNVHFMQSIVFPEVMRYNALKDGIESESLKTLYVQFGEEYANFSIGIFQMKPSFAEMVEIKCKQILPANVYDELQLKYKEETAENIRAKRIERLTDDDWQLIYLTAFIAICNKKFSSKNFVNDTEKLQWYASVYNAGFDKTDEYISKKIKEANFYLEEQMPGKKFKYAAIASYYFNKFSIKNNKLKLGTLPN